MTFYHDHDITPLEIRFPEARIPTDLDEYLFDLQGFVIVKSALSADEVAACNAAVDAIPRETPRGEWFRYIHREDHPEHRGISYQQIYEAGPAWERLIDHPSYINYVLRFVGGQDTFDYDHGPLFIDENFVNLRGPGQAIPIHSGGHDLCKRIEYRYHNGRFSCGQVNVLIAHTDIGPGDGATMLIRGSHKSNMIHPARASKQRTGLNEWKEGQGGSVEGVEGAAEVHLSAGDAVVFTDTCCHGSARRVNPGERRISVFRYGSAWNRTRWGYAPSDELLSRLEPFAREIVSVQTHVDLRPPVFVG